MSKNNVWVEKYGDRVIERVYETPSGCIFIVAKGGTEGLVKMANSTTAEWGTVDMNELERLRTQTSLNRPNIIFKKYVPCTLKQLFTKTVVWTYFTD